MRILFIMPLFYRSYNADERERENVSKISYFVRSAEAFDSCLFSSYFILLKFSMQIVAFEETGGNREIQNI